MTERYHKWVEWNKEQKTLFPHYTVEIDGNLKQFHTEEEYIEFIRIKKIKRLIKNINGTTIY